jgi:hypothetical protein
MAGWIFEQGKVHDRARPQGNVRCVKDRFGNYTCTDGSRVIKDSFGNVTVIPGRR